MKKHYNESVENYGVRNIANKDQGMHAAFEENFKKAHQFVRSRYFGPHLQKKLEMRLLRHIMKLFMHLLKAYWAYA